jgi:hypothetical protein
VVSIYTPKRSRQQAFWALVERAGAVEREFHVVCAEGCRLEFDAGVEFEG